MSCFSLHRGLNDILVGHKIELTPVKGHRDHTLMEGHGATMAVHCAMVEVRGTTMEVHGAMMEGHGVTNSSAP